METAMVTAVVAESRYDPRTGAVEALEARLTELARNGAPLRRALARIAGAFVERRAWEPLGFARLADYARERPGLSARELQDLAHVEAALAKLPAIGAALASGQVGWTKARLLCRVATPQDEGLWLAGALRLSAIRLEVDPVAPPPLARRVRSGMAEIAGMADPDVVAFEPAPTPAEPAPASPFVEALVAGLEDAEPHELDARLRRAAALEQGLLARIGPILLAFVAARGPWQLGFRGLDSYARERLAMSPRKARALLRLERGCALAPALGAAWRSGRITASQSQVLVPLMLAAGSEPFHSAWVERAAEVTVRRLEDDVEHALASSAFDPALLPEFPEGVQIGAEDRGPETDIDAGHGGRETDVWVANVPADVGRLFRACLRSVARRLNTGPGRALEAMFDHCLDTWRCPTPREHRVFARDGFRCTVPGCTSQRNLHAHHVLFRSAGGGDELANLVTLCAAHHLRGVHAGLIRIAGRAPDRLVFELPLGRFHSGDRVA
jgi:hypothetical protein